MGSILPGFLAGDERRGSAQSVLQADSHEQVEPFQT